MSYTGSVSKATRDYFEKQRERNLKKMGGDGMPMNDWKEDTPLPAKEPQELSDIAILSQYATKHGFDAEFQDLVEKSKREGSNLLELLVQAEKAYVQTHSIDTVIAPEREGLQANVLYRMAKRFGSKALCAIATPIRYVLAGALPGDYQKKIAEKMGENAINYTKTNIVFDLVLGTGLGSYLEYAFGHSLEPKILVAGFLGLLVTMVCSLPRFLYASDTLAPPEPWGSVVLLPLHILRGTYKLGEKGIKYLRNEYRQEEERVALPAKTRVETDQSYNPGQGSSSVITQKTLDYLASPEKKRVVTRSSLHDVPEDEHSPLEEAHIGKKIRVKTNQEGAS